MQSAVSAGFHGGQRGLDRVIRSTWVEGESGGETFRRWQIVYCPFERSRFALRGQIYEQ